MSEQNLEIKKEQQQEPLLELEQPLALETRVEGTYVPNRQRYLKTHTNTGFDLQGDYKSWSLGMLRDAMDNADYRVVGRTFRGSRTRKWETKRGKRKEKNKHSERMTLLMKSIDELTRMQSKRIDPEKAEEDVNYLKDIYNAIFEYAYAYCIHRSSIWPEGKARRDMVLLIRDQANEERMRLGNNARALVDEVRQNPNAAYTYGDAVKKIRTNTIRLGENGVTSITAGGNGTSELIIVEKNGKKLFVRASEDLKKDEVGPVSFFEDTTKELERRLNQLVNSSDPEEVKEREELNADLQVQKIFMEDLKNLPNEQVYQTRADMLIRKLCFAKPDEMLRVYRERTADIKDFAVYCPNIAKLFEEAQEEEHFKTYHNRKTVEIPNRKKEITAKLAELAKQKPLDQEEFRKLTQENDALDKEIKELDAGFREKDSAFSRMRRALKPTGRKLNQRNFARNVAKIPDGANVSNRNVAVSILARALGMQDIVAESEMVEVEIEGKKIRGVVMAEAKGGDILTIARQKKKEKKIPRYSTKVLKDLSRLHLADVLWGQIDRKSDNYMTEFTDKEDGTSEASSIMAIDNDMSCGLLDYNTDVLNKYSMKKGVQGMCQELPAISSGPDSGLLLEAVDTDLANRLLAMQPSYLDFLMLGILTPPEIRAMKKRLVTIQMILRERLGQESCGRTDRTVFMREEKDWEEFRDHIERNGHEVHSYYQNIYPIRKAEKKQ